MCIPILVVVQDFSSEGEETDMDEGTDTYPEYDGEASDSDEK